MASPNSAQQVSGEGGDPAPHIADVPLEQQASTDVLPDQQASPDAPPDQQASADALAEQQASFDRDLFVAAIYVATSDAVRSGRSVDVKELAKGILNAFPQSGVPIFEICEVIREATRSRVAA